MPGCRRTRGQRKGEEPIREDQEWICGPHWMAVPTFLRRRLSKINRRYTRTFGRAGYWSFPAGSPKRLAAVRLDRMGRKAWALCKRGAIERACGI